MSDEKIVPAMNREAWLQAAIQAMRPWFKGHNFDVPEVAVSVGWPSSGGLGTAKRTIGQCWYGETTANGMPQLFISPLLDDPADPMGVVPTLLHEVIHVVAGKDAKHGPKFGKIAKQLGLEGKPTSTRGGEELIERIRLILPVLGPFPHVKIVPDTTRKKQTTRMKKIQCDDCEYTVRTVQKWLDLHGPPICPCNKKVMLIKLNVETETENE